MLSKRKQPVWRPISRSVAFPLIDQQHSAGALTCGDVAKQASARPQIRMPKRASARLPRSTKGSCGRSSLHTAACSPLRHSGRSTESVRFAQMRQRRRDCCCPTQKPAHIQPSDTRQASGLNGWRSSPSGVAQAMSTGSATVIQYASSGVSGTSNSRSARSMIRRLWPPVGSTPMKVVRRSRFSVLLGSRRQTDMACPSPMCAATCVVLGPITVSPMSAPIDIKQTERGPGTM